MDYAQLINKARTNILNIIIILFAVIIALNVYIKKSRDTQSLKERQSTELRKNEIISSISELGKKIALLKTAVNNKSVSLVIDSISDMANEEDIKIDFIRPQAENNMGVYTRYPFDLVITAKDYHRAAGFISLVERSHYIYTVESVSLTFNSGGSEDKIKASMLLNTVLVND